MKKPSKITQHIFFIEVVKDVDPLPGDGQKCPLPLPLPHHVQLEDDLFDQIVFPGFP